MKNHLIISNDITKSTSPIEITSTPETRSRSKSHNHPARPSIQPFIPNNRKSNGELNGRKSNRWSVINTKITNFFNMNRKPSELIYQSETKTNIFVSIDRNYKSNLVDFKDFNEKVKSHRKRKSEGGRMDDSESLNLQYEALSKQNIDKKIVLKGKSCNYFGTNSSVRKKLALLVSSNIYQSFTLFMIFFSCILMAVDDPLSDSNSGFNLFLFIFDYILGAVWIFDLIANFIVFGVYLNGRNSYLKIGWNFMDFLVSILFILSLGQLVGSEVGSLKSLRMTRILRTMRLISRSEGLKLTINSFLRSLPSYMNLVLLVVCFFFMYAVFLVANFKGTFFQCRLVDIDIVIETKSDCFDYGGDWLNQDLNLDNVGSAMATLLKVSTTDGWVDDMMNMVNAVGVNKNPVYNYSLFWKYFMMVFISISTFMMLNLFTSLVVNSYQQEKDKQIGIANLTLQQKDWIKLQTRIFEVQPKVLVSLKF